MSRKLATVLGLLLSIMGPRLACAYEITNHREMSEAAARKSVLGQASLLMNLMLTKPIDDATQKFPSTPGIQYRGQHSDCKRGEPLTVLQLIACGAQFEDVPGPRSVNHFFDPANGGRPLTIAPFGEVGKRSPDWALEDTMEVPDQDFSYRDARSYFYNALTSLQSSQRNTNWGKLFQTIGQVIHHVQDMAQPQHVRNDHHCNEIVPCALPGILADLYHPSRFERHTRLDRVIANSIKPLTDSADGNAVYPGANNANVSILNTPRKFFVGAGRGIAEFTNANFVSEGTNFKYRGGTVNTHPAYPQPTPGQANAEPVSQLFPSGVPPFVQAACNVDPANCFLTFYSTNGLDLLTNQPFTNARASTLSIYDSDLEAYGATVTHVDAATGAQYSTSKVFSLNGFNFDAAYPFLIPRAVAYSAGLINYFFRGKLEISLPDEGVYGAVDHNDAAGNTKDTGGFGRIKLKLKNLTPAASGVEPMGPGKLRAVARFHRNNCYQPNLSGEYGSPGIDWRTCRSSDEDIVVSQEVDVASITDVAQPVTFLFPTRIPINATDLYLQVVYRGPLGEESDAVVVATKDISEPSYRYNYSRWDQNRYADYPSVELGTNTWAEWCAQGYASLEICNSSKGLTWKHRYSSTAAPIPGYDPATAAVPPGTWADLSQEPPFTPFATLTAPVGTLARIAVLVDVSPSNFALAVAESISTSLAGNSSLFQWFWGTPFTTINQRDPATDTLTPSVTYLPGRGVYLPAEENPLLTGGNEPNIPPLILVPSQVNF